MPSSSVSERLSSVMSRIARSAELCGRSAEDIILVGATKTMDAELIREAIGAGLRHCGENRVQELTEKLEQGAYEGSHIHFIGHLQRNKVNKVVGRAELIHGADSIALIESIDTAAARLGIVQDILLEVNVALEQSKSGFRPQDVADALEKMSVFPHVRVRGLMAIPPICSDGRENLPYFNALNKLFIDNSEKKYDNVDMVFMSMGMSGDFETAIACGANMVRIGSAIFGERKPKT